MTEAIIGGAVLASIAALAVNDARRAMVDPHMVLALLGAAAAWRFAGPGDGGAWARLADGVLGAALGIACVMAPIGAAQLWGRRWPLYPGDAMLLGAFGFLLGVPGLAWTMLLGSGFALLYRFWLQRRRGRPFRKGLVPLGPGMCAGAAVVFLCTTFGVALAQDRTEEPLSAIELGPALPALPAALAAREISVEGEPALAFPALARRISAIAGVATRIEERPARIAGGAAVLEDPPPLRLAWKGPLAGLLDRVAGLSGYDWSWDGTAIVFHRYWDVAQRAPSEPEAHGDAGASGNAGTETPERWAVDPDTQRTLRGVLEDWAARAGWTLVWNAGRDYGLGAAASFGGSFLEAADLLLSGPATRQVLDARAYPANRHLVVGDAGGAGW